MADPDPRDPEDRAAEVIRSFLSEPLLWPVGLVVVLTLATFGGAILLFAIRLRSFLPGIALLILIFLTVWGLEADFRERRLRPVSRVVLGLWGASALAAVGLEWLGAFR
jgi:hypothetical protein